MIILIIKYRIRVLQNLIELSKIREELKKVRIDKEIIKKKSLIKLLTTLIKDIR